MAFFTSGYCTVSVLRTECLRVVNIPFMMAAELFQNDMGLG